MDLDQRPTTDPQVSPSSAIPPIPQSTLFEQYGVGVLYILIGLCACYFGFADLYERSEAPGGFLYLMITWVFQTAFFTHPGMWFSPVTIGMVLMLIGVGRIVWTRVLEQKLRVPANHTETTARSASATAALTSEQFVQQAIQKVAKEPKIRNLQDFVAGAIYLFLGAGSVILSKINEYEVGTLQNPQEGFFPVYVGYLLAIVGVLVIVQSIRASAFLTTIERPDFMRITIVLLSVYMFAHFLPHVGIEMTAFLVVLMSATASHDFKFSWALVNAVVITIFVYVVFIVSLQLNMPRSPELLRSLFSMSAAIQPEMLAENMFFPEQLTIRL